MLEESERYTSRSLSFTGDCHKSCKLSETTTLVSFRPKAFKLHKLTHDTFSRKGSEFRRHRDLKVEQQEVTVFMFEWTEYAINLAKQMTVKSIQKDKFGSKVGKDLEPEAIEKFRSEQVVQLHELYRTAKGLDEVEVTEKK
jgi:hypothetical protein